MHPSQACTPQQLKTFMEVSGFKEGLTYQLNYFDKYENKMIDKCMFFLYRIGARLEIHCYKNDKLSHISDSSYIHSDVLETWQAIKASAAQINKNVLTPAK